MGNSELATRDSDTEKNVDMNGTTQEKNDSISKTTDPDAKGPSDEAETAEAVETLAEYEVERIMDKRVNKKGTEYLIKWVGYTIGQSTWEPAENIVTCDEKLAEFERVFAERRRTQRAIPSDLDLSETGLAKKATPAAVKSRPSKPKSNKKDIQDSANGEVSKNRDSVKRTSMEDDSSGSTDKCQTNDSLENTAVPRKKPKLSSSTNCKQPIFKVLPSPRMNTAAGVLLKPCSPSILQSPLSFNKPSSQSPSARHVAESTEIKSKPNATSSINAGAPRKMPQSVRPKGISNSSGKPDSPRLIPVETKKKQRPVPPPPAPPKSVVVATAATSVDLDQQGAIDTSPNITNEEKLEIRELRAVASKALKCAGFTKSVSGDGTGPYALIKFEGNWSKMYSVTAVKCILPNILLDFYENCVRLSRTAT